MSYPKCPECSGILRNDYGIVQDSLPPETILTCRKCDIDFYYSPEWKGEPMVLNKIKDADIDMSVEGQTIISKITLSTESPVIYACRIISGPKE